MGREKFDLAVLLRSMLRLQARPPGRALLGAARLAASFLAARRRGHRVSRREGVPVPLGIGLSPTVRCNLNCAGCYSRFHSQAEELAPAVLQRLVGQAVAAGVFLFVVSGGEPFLRPDLLDLCAAQPAAAFLLVTNGTLLDGLTVGRLAGLANVFPVVSVEGDRELTDQRRGAGVYELATGAMERLRRAGVPFGFSAVVTRRSAEVLGGEGFLAEMAGRGCRLGFYNDLIPVTVEDRSLLPEPAQARRFRERFQALRRGSPFLLVHLPDDEYGREGRCLAVAGGAMHINAQGLAEPCPFAHYARENVRDSSFVDLLRSPFLAAVREHPSVLCHGEVGCALVSNGALLADIAARTGAAPSRAAPC